MVEKLAGFGLVSHIHTHTHTRTHNPPHTHTYTHIHTLILTHTESGLGLGITNSEWSRRGYVCQTISLLPAFLPVCRSSCLSIRPFVYLSIYLATCLQHPCNTFVTPLIGRPHIARAMVEDG
jgi:hypothetical protein